MQLGKYDQRIEFVKYGQEPDGAGGYIPTREVILSSWASVEQLKQRKDLEAVSMGLKSAFRVRMMVRKEFKPGVGTNVEWRGKTYAVTTDPQVENVRMQQEWIFDITQSNG
ncbi:SPP1 family predicted phage head-tail adaptor [Sphingobacterium allocomposti]|uniref:SPP1 family predicted phage head-tail adaptor n=1 Tax=Sphingobacterium allocomposti TaxID=415956 RepID=A0A5S5D060_9SPHI|nr:phage head closure protein [Sphingobacterium composti Yoo et al. 2007 non Ten et al. 2007]TYP89421.1 SPP1 family predicted phage head-tail adaptor [Sphingobacterium composti Yoo et al. 2007 non Ten et al. 2007]